jgi:hypothetical protein
MMNNQHGQANGFRFLPRDRISVLFVNARESPAGSISGRQANSSRIHKDSLGGGDGWFSGYVCQPALYAQYGHLYAASLWSD